MPYESLIKKQHPNIFLRGKVSQIIRCLIKPFSWDGDGEREREIKPLFKNSTKTIFQEGTP
jgi:hypothetical protein